MLHQETGRTAAMTKKYALIYINYEIKQLWLNIEEWLFNKLNLSLTFDRKSILFVKIQKKWHINAKNIQFVNTEYLVLNIQC